MPTIPVLDLRPGDTVAFRGGWFTLAGRPRLHHRRTDRLRLLFVGGSRHTVHWLAHITVKGDA